MKKFVPFIAITFGLSASLQSVARAAEPVPTEPVPTEPKIAQLDATQNMLGKPLPGWIIPKSYWANTPEPIWLGGLRGDVVVVEFFRINCSHCQDAAPAREALHRKYRARGLKMIGFHSPGIIGDLTNDENKWDKVKIEVKSWGLNYPIAFDKDRVFFDKNEFRFYPTVLVLDKKGVVRFQQTGYSPEKTRELEQFVDGMLSSK